MTIETHAPSPEAEGSALPPPRGLGETNTVTLRQGARASVPGRNAMVAGWIDGSGDGQPLRVAIVAADSGALTLTF